jgi:hypothetical protein
LLVHAFTSKLTIFYSISVIELDGTSFAMLSPSAVMVRGERHENLSADGADRYTFDRDSLHFSARTAIENTPLMAGPLQA